MSLLHGNISLLDAIAMGWFFLLWWAYNWYTAKSAAADRSLVGTSHVYRLRWAQQLQRREARIVDASLVNNLMRSVSFYASTTIYVIGGLLAVWGTLDKAISLASDLHITHYLTQEMWELRLAVLTFVFVFAYFKFTWALREFNLLSLMIGAAPFPNDPEEERIKYAVKMAAVNSMAGDEFNRGVRSYYFGLAVLTWFAQAWLFMVATTLVVFILYRRDFDSRLLRIVRD